MTMDLVGLQGKQTFSQMGWRKLLQLAVQHGWKPAGVTPPLEASFADEPAAADCSPGFEERLQAAYEQDPERYGPILEEMARDSRIFAGVPQIDSYCVNSGCCVSAEDAQALADALEQALPDVPDHDAVEGKAIEDPSLPGERLIPLPVDAVEWFSGADGKRRLKSFIRYCRQGGFEIW